jgi:transcriptional regulator with XRE-family HTH domain
MVIGMRLKALREYKNLSQGDIERRAGLNRCYVSRVENGHTSPSLESLVKFARALDVPMFQLFYNGQNSPPIAPAKINSGWGSTGHDAQTLERLRRLLRRTSASNLKLLLSVAQKLAQRQKIST